MKLANWNDTPPLSEAQFADVKRQVDEYFKKQPIKAKHAMAQEGIRNRYVACVAPPKKAKQS